MERWEQDYVKGLLKRGKNVEILPTRSDDGRRVADFLIDGVRQELKSVSGVVEKTSDGISSAIASRVMDAKGQAADIIVDVSKQAGITPEIALRGVRRAFGADNRAGKKIMSITIEGPGWTMIVPRMEF